MNMISNLSNHLSKKRAQLGFLNASIYVVSDEGISVYADENPELEERSVGVLICGAWQAASSILKNSAKRELRFSFDTASQGFYVLPMCLMEKEFYLAGVYSEENHTGRLKMKLRLLRDFLEREVGVKDSGAEEKKDDPLFKNVTNEEIDSLFNF